MQTKTKLYAHTTTGNSLMDGFLPTTHCTGSNNGLSNQEKELYKALCHSKGKSSYARTIRQVCKEVERTGDVRMFRELINTICDMGQDNPRLLKNIIGTEAYTVLSHNDWLKQANGSLVLSNQIHSS
jgi:hypothetical protein